MAFNLTFRIIQSHKSASVPVRCKITTLSPYEKDVTPIMKPFGITLKRVNEAFGIPVSFDGWNTSSSISGYRKFLNTGALKNTDFDIVTSIPATGPYPEEVAIEEFATDAGALDSNYMSSYLSACRVTAMHAGASNNRVTIRADVYHRTSGGTETLIAQGSSDAVSNTTMTAYDFNVVLNTVFGTNERLVVKYFAQHTDVS